MISECRIEPLEVKTYQVLEAAFAIVARCTCGLDTCCYGCIATFNNQFEQGELSRGSVVVILGSLLGEEPDEVG